MDNLNQIKGLQVIIVKPIFLRGKIWDPKVYDNPSAVLIDCARNQYNIGERERAVFFAKNGVKFDPFTSLTMVGDIDDEDDVDNEDGELGDGNDVNINAEGNENEDEDDDAEGEETGDDANDEISKFKSADSFAKLSKSNQLSYVESIKDTPEGLSEEEVTDYESTLFDALTAYSKSATSSKAIALIDEVLAQYN